ncbi:DMP19 family protein [Flavobacterium sp. 3-210]
MNKELKINKVTLESTENSYDYLQIILFKYHDIINNSGENWIEQFTDEQHCLLTYGCLHNEMLNGGLIQLIWNGYNSYIFESRLIDTLEEWGAKTTAKLLRKIKDECYKLSINIENMDQGNLDEFSKLYKDFPQFETFDNEFYNNSGELEIKNYVEKNLSNFITAE